VCCVVGGYFLGICDPTGTLEEDEIFIHHDAGEREIKGKGEGKRKRKGDSS
jgi:hypothetical protein